MRKNDSNFNVSKKFVEMKCSHGNESLPRPGSYKKQPLPNG